MFLERKRFFFEKKEPKNFCYLMYAAGYARLNR
jgi:hypothetical protein